MNTELNTSSTELNTSNTELNQGLNDDIQWSDLLVAFSTVTGLILLTMWMFTL